MKPADRKLQRWIDLIAALLGHRYGVTFAELKGMVPAYGADKEEDAVARMFERDKDELRAIGLPIRVREEESDEGMLQRYYMRAGETYLPYLALASRGDGATTRVPPVGYRSVPTLAFEPGELPVLLRGARCAKATGPALAQDADSAIRKLTYDFGVALGSVAGESESDAVRIPEPTTAPTVCMLGDALLRRKRVAFTYHSMNRDVTDRRTVEPYGLFFSSGHWYLAGQDVSNGELRKFRLSRMSDVEANTKKPQSSDYEIPAHFRLAVHARTKDPWELGDAPAEEMIIEVCGESGATRAVTSLGEAVDGQANRRRFQVRRVDSFARWIMSFAGEVVPVSPQRLIDQYRTIVSSTLGLYAPARSAETV